MGYVENNLLPNEEIVYKAKIHWIIYRGVILPILALLLCLQIIVKIQFLCILLDFLV